MTAIAIAKFTSPEDYYDGYVEDTFQQAGARSVTREGYTVEVTLPDNSVFALARSVGKYGDDALNASLRNGDPATVSDFLADIDAFQTSDWMFLGDDQDRSPTDVRSREV